MEKYLKLYAEPETAALDDLPENIPGKAPWANVIVIPACNETSGFLRFPPPCGGRSLMILVINESPVASEEVSQNNRILAEGVEAGFELLWEYSPTSTGFGMRLLRDLRAPRDLLLVDRFSAGRQLPEGGGVGLARKIGADLATALIHRQRIRSGWIHCSDGDVHLPDSYFRCSNTERFPASTYAALVYPYCHTAPEDSDVSEEVLRATWLYELSLRYYVAGLRFAGSPYAFNTIGSTMAVSAASYAKVRGFPKREAGEDFYLLNKLAKVGQVRELVADTDCEPLRIEARKSDRVPFGTGAAVNRITGLADPVRDYLFYDSEVFQLLRHFLQSWPVIWQSGSQEGLAVAVSGQPGLLESLQGIGVEKALTHAFGQSSDLDQFTLQMHTWFDAFRTLKLIHALREHHLPSVNYAELVSGYVFRQLLTQDDDLRVFFESGDIE